MVVNWFAAHVRDEGGFCVGYVFEAAARHGGIAAVPLRNLSDTRRDADAVPRCAIGLRMYPTFQFDHTYGYRAQRFRCPLLFPTANGASCVHAQFLKGKGCVKDLNWERGGKMRVTLDRQGPLYQALYTQRTCA